MINNRYLIKWFPDKELWCYSTNGGKAWNILNADDPDASYQAINEASELLGVPTNEWEEDETT